MLNTVSIAIRTLLSLTFITGIFYPIVITGFSERFFPVLANGSLIQVDGKIVGSELIGQRFTKNEYFWSRPSAGDYATVASSASNLSATNASLKAKVEERKKFLLTKHPDQKFVPPDLLFASGSGLDPHISPESVQFQANRIISARRLTREQILRFQKIIEQSTERPAFGYIGEKRVNVLRLNLKLDDEFGKIKE
ncbi:K+-transporting ATPase, C subunit [Leptospira weilii str. 2006001853]|uniref:Potassium-transporting ATPase KdpC subunit n=1 Tax=Leptospira weilii str. 2006001853 TaxID=1001589 RepID=A0A828YUM7_9LEPT|nr:potassium-transporting ATPase subunit KdpC [Leptospira weilii]EKR62427.1 K+-transporting ATPase, C subunit [Leptospira weilii str. 2006001853]EMN42581.1 K+-transporting ATPase, C subunit [Leptospira weilii str. LNT 1234]QDK22385.1 potassium-transporting ATPase subunit KdpC [Leptospira weilii]QDK26329.1 potassium-transporting ATPase subunit KdpC [Leptospira weilii]ULH27759.1 potassium-transporting ATPase subunit KdpC [Leptospira weilii]